MALSFLTFNDAIAHLRDANFGISQDAELAILKRAARGAYRDLIDSHRWRYGLIEYGQRLVASYETGTVAYDHTGGAFERMVSLTSGTWPTEAQHYKLFVGTGVYPVQERKSATVLTLDPTINPGEDIAAGTSYTLYRDTYPLPDDFLKSDEILSQSSPWFNWYIDPREYLSLETTRHWITSRPFRWTIMQDATRPGGWCLRVVGHPTSATNLVFQYQRAFKEPVLSGHESFSYSTAATITVALAQNGYTVTGTGTAFNQKMVNSVLRVSEDGSHLPTDNGGAYPFAQELLIRSVESATSLTTWQAASGTVTGRKFVISDPLDMDRTMFNAYLRGCEWQSAVIMGKNVGENARTVREYQTAVRLAMQQDNKVTVPSVAGVSGGFVGPLSWLLAFGGVTHNQGVS